MLLLVLALLAAPALGRQLGRIPAIITASDGYIIGGSDARLGQFPHQGSLQFKSDGRHTCGCSLLSAKWVITAAHCVGSGASEYQVQFGVFDRTVANQGQTVPVKAVTIHPDFELNPLEGFPNDIAMIEVEGSVDVSAPNVKVIALAKPADGDFAGQDCAISGWGLTQTGGEGTASDKLQWAPTKPLTIADCEDELPQSNGEIHICVGAQDKEGACNGDSGGPLTCGDKLAGLTSWGINGCWPSFPSVYTRVSKYESWVSGITGL